MSCYKRANKSPLLGGYMSKFWLLVLSPFIAFFLWVMGDKIGWLNIGFFFFVLVALLVIFVVLEDRKIKDKVENDRYDEYIASLKHRDGYNPLFPHKEEEKVTLSDLVETYFETIKAAVPTDENPLKAKITYTNPKGENFDVNLEIKPKSQK